MDFKHIMDKLADELPRTTLKGIKPLAVDKWILASGLQKSIRKGDARLASAFALSLTFQDRKMLWRRLITIALEDIGCANSDLVQTVLATYKSPASRIKIGDIELGVHLARQMASSVKSRYLTEMIFYTDLHPSLAKARKCAEKTSGRQLAKIIQNSKKTPGERFLGLRALAGTKLYPAQGFMRQGDMNAVIRALRTLSAPPTLTEACISILRDVRHPLALFAPLGWETFAQEKGNLRVEKEKPLCSPQFESVPAFAVDPIYTRTGQTSMRQLQKTVPALRCYSLATLGEAWFFLENETLTQRMTSDNLDHIRRESINSLMNSLGVDEDEHAALRRCLSKNFDLFNEIRIAQLQRSLYGATQNDLFFGEER